jgi:hypothetical protein
MIFFPILSCKFEWNLYCDVDTTFYNGPLLHLIWKRSFFRWRRFHLQGLKTGLCSNLRVLPIQILQMWRQEHYQRLVFKWHKRFSDGRGSLMDDKREGRPSFKTSDVVKNEVCDVIDGDRRLTDVDTKFYSSPLLHLIWKHSFFRWRRFHLQGLKTGLRSHLRVLPIPNLQMWRRFCVDIGKNANWNA